MNLYEFFATYLAWKRHRIKPRTHLNVSAMLARWADHFPDRTPDSIRRADIAAFITHLQESGLMPGTINAYLVALSGADTYATSILELPLSNPVASSYRSQKAGCAIYSRTKPHGYKMLYQYRAFRTSACSHSSPSTPDAEKVN